MVTAGTFKKNHLLNSPDRLDFFLDQLFECAADYKWQLQAWAVLSNHYHFIALSSDQPDNLGSILDKLHGVIARKFNRDDGTVGRMIFYQFWDSHITFQRSYLARLNYVHQNPVHHGVVRKASEYPWCSAAGFEQRASRAFFNTLSGFKIDRIRVMDDF